MSKHWYVQANLKNNNWYLNGRFSDNMDIPKCVNCNDYIIQNDDEYLCHTCLDYINKKLTPRALALMNPQDEPFTYVCEHIPEFSIITVRLDDYDYLTVSVDWGEALIVDVIEDDCGFEDFNNYLKKQHKNIDKKLIQFIIELGQEMYPEIFDKDALRANDNKLNNIIRNNFLNSHSKHKGTIVAWKALNNSQLKSWKKSGFIPNGEIFSLADYFSLERKSSAQDGWVLLKIFADKNDVFRRRNKSIELNKDFKINKNNVVVM